MVQYNSRKIRLWTHASRWCVLKLQIHIFCIIEKTYILYPICTRQKCLTFFFVIISTIAIYFYILYVLACFAYLDYLGKIPNGQDK